VTTQARILDAPSTRRRAALLTRMLPGWPASTRPGSPHVIGVLAGEGIGPEVIRATLAMVRAIESCTDHRFEIRHGGLIGLDAVRETGRALTPEVVGFCRAVFAAQGALICGPGGGRFVYELRKRFDLYCKMTPLQPLPALRGTGVLKPEAVRDVDILVVRENTGGLYLGESGIEERAAGLRAFHKFHYDETEVIRILRVAIAAAADRRGRLCVVTKPAGAPAISELWRRGAERLVAESDVELQILEVDTACYQLVAEASRFDVVAAPNMFGDVLADGASLLLGSRGMSYSGNFSDDGVAVYQTGHGAAYDLAGRDQANPCGQIQSLAMMLRESFGLGRPAAQLLAAMNETLHHGWRTPDIMASGRHAVGTQELGERIAATLSERLSASSMHSRQTAAEAAG
jgi:3-isopropylmalate dehydrogenase